MARATATCPPPAAMVANRISGLRSPALVEDGYRREWFRSPFGRPPRKHEGARGQAHGANRTPERLLEPGGDVPPGEASVLGEREGAEAHRLACRRESGAGSVFDVEGL